MELEAPIGEKVLISTGKERKKARVKGFSKNGWMIIKANGTVWGRSYDPPNDSFPWDPNKGPFLQVKSAVFFPDLEFKTDEGEIIESCFCDWELEPEVQKKFDENLAQYKKFVLEKVKVKDR